MADGDSTKDDRNNSFKKLLGAVTAPPAAPVSSQPGFFGNAARELGGSVVQGAGQIVGGVGEAFNSASGDVSAKDRLINPGDAIKNAGAAISGYGTGIQDKESDAAKEAKAGSMPTVDLAHPIDSFSAGSNPSLSGYALNALGLVGQAAPVIAAARLPGSATQKLAQSALVGAAQGGGAASQQENERIAGMSDDDIAKLPAYQERIAKGMSPTDARADLASTAGTTAFDYTAPTGALSALSEGLPQIGKAQSALAKLVGTSRVARSAAGAGFSAATGALHGGAFGAAQQEAENEATGENGSVSQAAGNMAIMGGVAGAAGGAFGGLHHVDEAGNPVPQTDANGNPTTDAQGQPVSTDASAVQPKGMETPAAVRRGVPLPDAGPLEQAAVAKNNPPEAQQPAPTAAPVVDAQPDFKAGSVTSQGGVEVAPNVSVDPDAGPLSHALSQSALAGDMDKPASVTLDDGTTINPHTGEVTSVGARGGQAEAAPAPEAPKPVKPKPDELDQIILERLQSNPMMDGRTTAMLARTLGVNLSEISSAKKRVRDFMAKSTEEGESVAKPTDTDEAAQPAAGETNATAKPGEAPANEAPATDLTRALKNTDRATGPDGAKYIISKNANDDGYHFTRTTDGEATQHTSQDPEEQWTRQQAIQAAHVTATERAELTKGATDVQSAKPADSGTAKPDDVSARAEGAAPEKEPAAVSDASKAGSEQGNAQVQQRGETLRQRAARTRAAKPDVEGATAAGKRPQESANARDDAGLPVAGEAPATDAGDKAATAQSDGFRVGSGQNKLSADTWDKTLTSTQRKQALKAAGIEKGAQVRHRFLSAQQRETLKPIVDRMQNGDRAPAPASVKPSDYGTKNKVFTSDAADKARKVLKSKLTQLNSGFDPETLQAGITLAGYHIEAGARKFTDFARAMVNDLGDAVKPHLLSWYEAIRHHPSMADEAKDMTPTAEAKTSHDAGIPEIKQEQDSEKANAAVQTETQEGAPNERDTAAARSDTGSGADVRGNAANADGETDARTGSDAAGREPAAEAATAAKPDAEEGQSSQETDRDVERRQDVATRARIDALPPDERNTEIDKLRTRNAQLELEQRMSEVTGLRNKKAFDEDANLGWKYVGAGDMDGLKKINDILGHASGDALLKAIGTHLKSLETDGVRFYHRSGDEFAARAKDPAEGKAALERAQSELDKIKVELSDGKSTFVYDGIGLSVGHGDSYDAADTAANKNKADRLAAGQREEPRENGAPRRLSEKPAEGVQTDVDQNVGRPDQETDNGKAGVTDGDNVRSSVADDGRAPALETPPAAAVRETQEQREAGSEPARSGAGDEKGNGRAGKDAGNEPSGSVAGSASGVSDSKSERLQQRNRTATQRDITDRKVDIQQPAGERPRNFVITPDLKIGSGGARSKAAGNLEAIRTLKKIEDENRLATPDEQAVLAKYVGWGGIPQAFAHATKGATKGWEKLVADLEKHMTPDELAAARRSTQDAHYTSPEVVHGVYDALQKMGFKGGLTLEPAMGTGNFLGLAPDTLRGALRFKGVELDPITGRIARQLYPEASISDGKGFQDVNVPENHFDAVVGNPPFGATKLFDAKNKDLSGFSIHNFFFAKSLKALKPGGTLGMVVSHQMLDKLGGKQREWMADKAKFLGAIRLPDTAFEKNAGTKVTTDIVFMQKLRPGEVATDRSWTKIGSVPDPAGGEPIPLNQYFIDHPEMMLGDMTRQGQMRAKNQPTLTARDGADLAEQLRAATDRLPKNVADEPTPVRPGENTPYLDMSPETPVYGHYVAPDGRIMQRLPDVMGEPQNREVELSGRDALRVKAMIDMRDRLKGLMRSEMNDAGSAMIEAQRKSLNNLYDDFQKKFGYLNNSYNANLFRDDADAYRLRALEKSYEKIDHADAVARGLQVKNGRSTVEQAQKADILEKRVFQPEKKFVAETSDDALAISLNTHGRVNVDAMADMLGKPKEQIIKELGDKLFNDPKSGYVTADEYLSGNVKAKLAAAVAMAKEDPSYQRNVDALQHVQPPDVNPADIYVSLGSPWVHDDIYADFARKELGIDDAQIKKYESLQKFTVTAMKRGVEKFGTQARSARDIFEASVNNQPVTVYRTERVNGKEVRTIDNDATTAAAAAQDAMREHFGDWVWKDDARRARLAQTYNDTYNTDRARTHDGSHLSFPGKVDDSVIKLRPTQVNAVWRSIQDGKVLMDHVVGAGKTYTAITAAMTKRRMGLARKPTFAVPNHLVEQWAADWMRLYPAAKIIAVTKNDFTKDRRKLLFSRIATGDFDGVIVAHSQFTRIKPPKDFEQRYMQEKIQEYEDTVAQLNAAGEDKRTIKQIEAQRDSMKEKLKAKMEGIDRDEDTAHFDEMGIDDLSVDEAHEFKNLGFVTRKRNVSGLGNPAGSQKAEDLFIKTRYLNELNGGRGLSLMTGTPVSNSLAEMYTMQRYLAYDDMKARGVHGFDLWANTFAQEKTEFELDSSGRGLKPKTVLSKFLNVPEMMQLYKRYADTVTMADLKRMYSEANGGKEFPIPKVTGGKPNNEIVQPSHGLLSYIENNIIPRMEAIQGLRGAKPDPSVDNMLKVTNDARLAALDVRLKDPEAPDDPGSKTNTAVKNIVDKWKATAADRGAQLVFCDLSTPKAAVAKERAAFVELNRKAEAGDEDAQAKLAGMSQDELLSLSSGFSVYDDMRAKLQAAGIPAREIAFIHDANTDLQKKQLFDKVNRGDIRVLMGSTSKMGAGMNVQQRLVALHHLDAPWRPSDVEQREGRIIRQGNELYNRDPSKFTVDVNRYATERTYDSRMWQLIERKAGIVEQIRKADPNLREVDDVSGEAANAAEMKAAATGNPLLIEQVETQAQVQRLTSLKKSYDRRVYDAQAEIGRLSSGGGPEARNAENLADAEAAEKVIAANPREPFAANIGGQAYDKFSEAATALNARVIDGIAAFNNGSRKPIDIGTFRGATMRLQRDLGTDVIHVNYPDARLGDIGQTGPVISDGKVSGAGLLTQVNNAINRMSNWRSEAAYSLARDTKRLAELQDVVNQPFKQAGILASTSARLKEITNELTKSAAPKLQSPDPATKKLDQMDSAPTAAPAIKQPNIFSARAKEIRDHIGPVIDGLKKSGINAVVVDDPRAIPDKRAEQKSMYGGAKGLVRHNDDGTKTIYLVASNIKDNATLDRVLAHELVGHVGMQGLLGDRFGSVASDALALVRSNPKFKDIAERVLKYKNLGEDTMGSEAIAMMAEKGHANGILARVYSALRSFLRDHGFDIKYNEGDIKSLLREASRSLYGDDAATRPTITPGAKRSPFADQFDLADGQTLADAEPKRVQDAIRDAATLHLRGLPDAIAKLSSDFKGERLGALTLNQLGDVSEKYLPQVKDYDNVKQKMMTRRNVLEDEFGPTAKKWANFQTESRRNATAEQRKNNDTDSDRTTAVMHDATIAGVDPEQAYKPGTVKLSSGETVAASDGYKIAAELEARAAKTPNASAAGILQRDAMRLREAADSEAPRQAAYPDLKKRFDALPAKGKEIYREARDLYAKRADDQLNAILGRIDSLEVPKEEKLSLQKQMRAHFESARVTAPYFPLARFGEYWVSAEKNGQRVFKMMESEMQQKRISKAFKDEGYDVRGGTKLDTVRSQDGASGSFMASVAQMLQKEGVPKEAADEIYQLYLRTLPDLSVRKNFIHRKGTPGYDNDALRAFAAHAQHGSYQLARMENAPKLESYIRAMKEQVAEHVESGDIDKANTAGRMYDEMLKRHQWLMNPTHSDAIQKLTSMNFVYYLGLAAPAHLTQNAIMTFPILAAKHGYLKAMTEMVRGMGQSVRTYGHTEKMLSGDELRAWQALKDSGNIDTTFIHDIAGLGDSDTKNYTGMGHRVMTVMSHLFHKSDVMNRESSGMASYRLERAAGASHDDAVKAAIDTINEAHGKYDNANRARWMQGNVGKTVFAMKQWSQHMTYQLWRNFYKSYYQDAKGALGFERSYSPEERQLARRKLNGVLAMTAMFSGVLGLPLMSMTFAASNAMHTLFGNPDEPFDAETEFRSFLTDHLGTDLGRTVASGPVNQLTGLDIGGRSKLDQMWYRDADREQEGRTAADYMLEQVAGPTSGYLLNTMRAKQLMEQGEYERALETIVPKFVRDGLKVGRYATEGVTDQRGNQITSDLSPFELAGQAAGYAPARVSEQYALNNALTGYQQQITERRKALIDGYAMAMRLSDTEGIRAAYEQIAAFNATNPEVKISSQALRKMLSSRQKLSERAINGLVLNKKLESKVRAAADYSGDAEAGNNDGDLESASTAEMQ